MADEEHRPDTQIVDISDSLDEDAVSAMLDRTVAGKYRILRRLARGGMGVVYVAEHMSLGRKVVIKVLSYHLADDKRATARFEREARGLSVLDHPNVITVHDFGIEQGLTYIVMEFVDGENLSQRVRRKGRLPYDQLLPIVIQTIDAIAAAHEKGIVHRDVKPSNVMVTSKAGRADFVKVLDFGLAKLATNSVDITKGNLVGTVSYLSPEVIKGGDALPAADVYALGVMFYYLIAGSKPFQAGDDMSVLYQHVNVEPDFLGDVLPPGEAPPEFLEFIHLCMMKDPSKRPRDAMEMRERLAELVSLPSISAFSLDSSMALPRYRPPDSSGESIKRPRHITAPAHRPAGDSESTTERPSMDFSAGSMTRPSIAMGRPKRSVRVAVIAFTSFSIGLLAILGFLKANSPDPAPVPVEQPAPKPPPEPVVEPPTVAVFSLTTNPAAQVALDGDMKGRAPIRLEMQPGRHVVSVSEPGYKPWTRSIEIAAGQDQQVEVFLEKRGSSQEPVVKADENVAIEPVTADVVHRPRPKPLPREVVKPNNTQTNNAPAVTNSGETTAKEPPPKPDPPKETGDGKSNLLSVDGKKSGLLPVGK